MTDLEPFSLLFGHLRFSYSNIPRIKWTALVNVSWLSLSHCACLYRVMWETMHVMWERKKYCSNVHLLKMTHKLKRISILVCVIILLMYLYSYLAGNQLADIYGTKGNTWLDFVEVVTRSKQTNLIKYCHRQVQLSK